MRSHANVSRRLAALEKRTRKQNVVFGLGVFDLLADVRRRWATMTPEELAEQKRSEPDLSTGLGRLLHEARFVCGRVDELKAAGRGVLEAHQIAEAEYARALPSGRAAELANAAKQGA